MGEKERETVLGTLKVNLSEDMTCESRNEQCNKQEESSVNGISKVPVYRIQQSNHEQGSDLIYILKSNTSCCLKGD